MPGVGRLKAKLEPEGVPYSDGARYALRHEAKPISPAFSHSIRCVSKVKTPKEID